MYQINKLYDQLNPYKDLIDHNIYLCGTAKNIDNYITVNAFKEKKFADGIYYTLLC